MDKGGSNKVLIESNVESKQTDSKDTKDNAINTTQASTVAKAVPALDPKYITKGNTLARGMSGQFVRYGGQYHPPGSSSRPVEILEYFPIAEAEYKDEKASQELLFSIPGAKDFFVPVVGTVDDKRWVVYEFTHNALDATLEEAKTQKQPLSKLTQARLIYDAGRAVALVRTYAQFLNARAATLLLRAIQVQNFYVGKDAKDLNNEVVDVAKVNNVADLTKVIENLPPIARFGHDGLPGTLSGNPKSKSDPLGAVLKPSKYDQPEEEDLKLGLLLFEIACSTPWEKFTSGDRFRIVLSRLKPAESKDLAKHYNNTWMSTDPVDQVSPWHYEPAQVFQWHLFMKCRPHIDDVVEMLKDGLIDALVKAKKLDPKFRVYQSTEEHPAFHRMAETMVRGKYVEVSKEEADKRAADPEVRDSWVDTNTFKQYGVIRSAEYLAALQKDAAYSREKFNSGPNSPVSVYDDEALARIKQRKEKLSTPRTLSPAEEKAKKYVETHPFLSQWASSLSSPDEQKIDAEFERQKTRFLNGGATQQSQQADARTIYQDFQTSICSTSAPKNRTDTLPSNWSKITDDQQKTISLQSQSIDTIDYFEFGMLQAYKVSLKFVESESKNEDKTIPPSANRQVSGKLYRKECVDTLEREYAIAHRLQMDDRTRKFFAAPLGKKEVALGTWLYVDRPHAMELSRFCGFNLKVDVPQGQTLQEWKNENALKTPEKIHIYYDCVRAMMALHSMDLVHGNFRPRNIHLKWNKLKEAKQINGEPVVVIDDFMRCQTAGEAVFKLPSDKGQMYQAPESIETEMKSTKSSDVYSLCMVGIELFMDYALTDKDLEDLKTNDYLGIRRLQMGHIPTKQNLETLFQRYQESGELKKAKNGETIISRETLFKEIGGDLPKKDWDDVLARYGMKFVADYSSRKLIIVSQRENKEDRPYCPEVGSEEELSRLSKFHRAWYQLNYSLMNLKQVPSFCQEFGCPRKLRELLIQGASVNPSDRPKLDKFLSVLQDEMLLLVNRQQANSKTVVQAETTSSLETKANASNATPAHIPRSRQRNDMASFANPWRPNPEEPKKPDDNNNGSAFAFTYR